MADEENGAAAAVTDDTSAAQTAADADAPQTDPTVEAEAREMGWLPKEKFKGDPTLWRPADEYLKRGKELMPLMQAENRRLKKQIAEVEERSAKTIENLGRMNKLVVQRLRKQIEAEYEEKMAKAVELGDKRLYSEANKGKNDALKEFDKAASEAEGDKGKAEAEGISEPGKMSVRDRDILDDWMDENPWMDDNATMRRYADRAFERIRRDNPRISWKDALAEVREKVEARYPDEFAKGGKPTASSAPKVDGGGSRSPGGGSNGRAWDKLPAEVKKIADSLIEDDGLFLEKGEKAATHKAAARERYAKQYLQENA
jgi:hypothetical protein